MKYWHVFYSVTGSKYMLADGETYQPNFKVIATFMKFDMAYDYVTKLNGNCMNNAYSRWTVR